MAYNVKWDPEKAEECKAEAEKKANLWAQQPDLFGDQGYLYRFDEQRYATIIPYANPISGDGEWSSMTQLELQAFSVKKWHNIPNPNGATLWMKSGARHRYVNFGWTKQFACRTIEEALESYIARRNKQARIYRARAEFAEKCILVAKGEARF